MDLVALISIRKLFHTYSNLPIKAHYSKFGIIKDGILHSLCSMPPQYIDKNSLDKIREKLWTASQKKGITLEDIQDRTNFSYSQVYRIVRGKNNISVSHIMAVCKALEIQPVEVFNFELEIPQHSPVRKELKTGIIKKKS